MIRVTRRDGQVVFINAHLVLSVESTPDTVITLSNGDRFMVQDKVPVVVDALDNYWRKIHGPLNTEGKQCSP